jgi:hypothetical protein
MFVLVDFMGKVNRLDEKEKSQCAYVLSMAKRPLWQLQQVDGRCCCIVWPVLSF